MRRTIPALRRALRPHGATLRANAEVRSAGQPIATPSATVIPWSASDVLVRAADGRWFRVGRPEGSPRLVAAVSPV